MTSPDSCNPHTAIAPSNLRRTDMTAEPSEAARKWMRWTGYALSALVIAFTLVDATMKLLQLPVVLETTAQIGWPVASVVPLGIVLLISTALYAFRPTAVLGAILLTAYLGGAVATHARIGSPIFSHMLFGVYIGIMLWGGLYLRDDRLRALIPYRR
jgi:predicted anti-sigma-YlaC factor YlaD